MANIAKQITEECKKYTGINPIEIFNEVAKKDFVRIHGPEHHVLDGSWGRKMDFTSKAIKGVLS